MTSLLGQLKTNRRKMPDVTVVVPIHGTESYLNRCLSSILAQSFENFEVICVDDCSPDHSAAIVSYFAARDRRVRFVQHSTNLGLGGARNTGIREATAKFVMGVDSDDYIHPQMIEDLYRCITSTGSDIAECGYAEVTEQGKILNGYAPHRPTISIDRTTNIFNLTTYSFWNKIYKRELFLKNDVWFPNNLYYEDLATTPRLISRSQSISYIGEQRYNYVQRQKSITNTIKEKNILDYLRVFDIIIEDLYQMNLFDHHQPYLKDIVSLNLNFIKKKIAASGDSQKLNLIRYANFVERACLDYAPGDPPHIGASDRTPRRPEPNEYAAARLSPATPFSVDPGLASIKHIAIVSAYDEAEAVMRMKIGALRKMTEGHVSFERYSNSSMVTDAILINHLDPLEELAQDLERFGNQNTTAPIVALVSDYYPRVAQQVKRFDNIIDAYVVPTREISICLSAHTRREVIVIPDPIDFLLEDSLPKKHIKSDYLDVVWFGYPESFHKSMLEYSPLLEQHHRAGRIRYHIITDVKNFNNIDDALIHQYRQDSFCNTLPLFDACVLSHMPDDFKISTYFKSENKAVLAINRGVPVLASRTPSYERLLRELGLEDYLFSSVDELDVCLNMICDPEKRNDFIDKSQSKIYSSYSYKEIAQQLLNVFNRYKKYRIDRISGGEHPLRNAVGEPDRRRLAM